jgi:hypothetical protein
MQLDEGDDGLASVAVFVTTDGALVVHSQQVRRLAIRTPSRGGMGARDQGMGRE